MPDSVAKLEEYDRHLETLGERYGPWSEEGLSTSLNSYAPRFLFNQSERYRHFAKWKEKLDSSKFRCLERLYISLIEIVLCKCNLLLSVR